MAEERFNERAMVTDITSTYATIYRKDPSGEFHVENNLPEKLEDNQCVTVDRKFGQFYGISGLDDLYILKKDLKDSEGNECYEDGGTQIKNKKKSNKSAKQKSKKGGCWKGYERVPGTVQYAKGSCRKIVKGKVSKRQTKAKSRNNKRNKKSV
jgi:hypothetical protein